MNQKAIIVANEKHGDFTFDASTPEQWALSSLYLLTQRYRQGYWYLTPEEMYPDVSEGAVMSDEAIQDLPAHLQQPAIEARSRTERNLSKKLRYTTWYERVKKCVEEQDLSFINIRWNPTDSVVPGKGAAPVAWRLLEWRKDHEYEYVSLEGTRAPTLDDINDLEEE